MCAYIHLLGVGVHCYDYLPFYNEELLLRLPVRSLGRFGLSKLGLLAGESARR